MPAKSEKQRRFFYLVKALQKRKVSSKRVGGKVSKVAKSMSSKDVDDFTYGKNLPKKKLEEVINCLKEINMEPPKYRFNEQKVEFFKFAQKVKESKIKLSEEERNTLLLCLECFKDPMFDLRYATTAAGSNGGTPIEPMNLENQDDLRVDTTGKPIDPHYLDEEGEDTTMNVDVNPIAKTFKQQGNFDQYVDRFSGLEIKPKEMESITNYTNAKPTKVDRFVIRYEGTDEFNNNTITVVKKLREGNDLVFTIFQSSSQQTPENGEQSETDNEIIVNKSRAFRDDIEGGRILADLLQKLEI